jgi:hypothetical protein
MVTIANLTQEQVELCDKLWACDTVEDVQAFISGLPEDEQHEAKVMQTMMLSAIIDDEVNTQDDCDVARNILDRVSSY